MIPFELLGLCGVKCGTSNFAGNLLPKNVVITSVLRSVHDLHPSMTVNLALCAVALSYYLQYLKLTNN